MEAAISCPGGINSLDIVFLVHGTGSTGAESWKNGPYNILLPSTGDGFDICWVRCRAGLEGQRASR